MDTLCKLPSGAANDKLIGCRGQSGCGETRGVETHAMSIEFKFMKTVPTFG